MNSFKKTVLIGIFVISVFMCCGCKVDKAVVNVDEIDNQAGSDAVHQGVKDDEKDIDKDNDKNNEKDKDQTEITNEQKDDNDMNTGIQWEEEAITVYKPYSGGVWYPRMYELKNGKLLCGFDTNEDGGRAVIKIVTSEDSGLTWSEEAIKATDYPEYDCANANFIELDNGDIWLSYRANVLEGEEYYSSIRISVSKDGGITWEPHSIVAEEQGTGGIYEPQFGFIGDKIAVFYANDSLNVVRNNRQQNIEFKIWEEEKWSEKIIASDGTKTFSRDGMPVWCQLEDGSYALVIESTSLSPSSVFMIQMKTSLDGLDWSSKLQDIYIPRGLGKKAGAPYIVKLMDGRVAVSFQTDEDASGTGDGISNMKVMISTDITGKEFLACSVPFETPDGFCSNWNGLLSYQDYLYAVTSTNYPEGSILLKRGLIK